LREDVTCRRGNRAAVGRSHEAARVPGSLGYKRVVLLKQYDSLPTNCKLSRNRQADDAAA
jgi:hypothetical protein